MRRSVNSARGVRGGVVVFADSGSGSEPAPVSGDSRGAAAASSWPGDSPVVGGPAVGGPAVGGPAVGGPRSASATPPSTEAPRMRRRGPSGSSRPARARVAAPDASANASTDALHLTSHRASLFAASVPLTSVAAAAPAARGGDAERKEEEEEEENDDEEEEEGGEVGGVAAGEVGDEAAPASAPASARRDVTCAQVLSRNKRGKISFKRKEVIG